MSLYRNPEPSSSAGLDRNLLLDFPNLSYSAQYDLLYSRDLDAKKVQHWSSLTWLWSCAAHW